jgi:hypothetical protein
VDLQRLFPSVLVLQPHITSFSLTFLFPLSPHLPSNPSPFPLIYPVPHPLSNPTTHTSDSIAKTQQPIPTPRTLHIPPPHASNLYAAFTNQPLHLEKTSPLILSPLSIIPLILQFLNFYLYFFHLFFDVDFFLRKTLQCSPSITKKCVNWENVERQARSMGGSLTPLVWTPVEMGV